MTTTTITLTNDELDELDGILGSLHASNTDALRMKLRAAKAESEREQPPSPDIKPGIRVQLTGNLSPRYLIGMQGEALTFPTETKHRRVKVRIDENFRERAGRYVRPDGTMSIPGNCLKVVTDG